MFGSYYDGRPKLVLKEDKTDKVVAIATINLSQDGVVYSKINSDIIIKSWGVNDGLYEVLRDNNIISKAHTRLPVGLNEACVCMLLINPEDYEEINSLHQN